MTKNEEFEKLLSITAAFEGNSYGGCNGNFDGQGISAFVLSFPLGQHTLQKVLLDMYAQRKSLFQQILGSRFEDFFTILTRGSRELEQKFVLEATEGKQFECHPEDKGKYFEGGRDVREEWRKIFSNLGFNFKGIQLQHAQKYFDSALEMFNNFHMETERGLAFMFDQAVQRGGASLSDEYSQYVDKLLGADLGGAGLGDEFKMRWILENDLPDFQKRYRPDVQSRRLCIIEGHGKVHGKEYDLRKEFNLTDTFINFS